MPPLRILVVAPFERGLAHGGSQRATAVAERLEERGAEIEWITAAARRTSPIAKAAGALALRPTLLGLYSVSLAGRGEQLDAAISAHSYLAPQLRSLPPGVARVIDFHNLEWRHLKDSAAYEEGARRLYGRLQVALMRRFERRAIAASQLSAFVSEEELRWAREAAPQAPVCLVPTVLPRATEREALDTGPAPSGAELVYVGTLRFPPNFRALLRFLREAWPAIRDAMPEVRLTVAGNCSEEARRAIGAFPGVEAVGFVPDVRELLRRSIAAIMPIEGRAGTSLRALYCALGRVWVIGSAAAFRGIPWEMGATVSSSRDWAEAVREAAIASDRRERRIAAAHDAALALQQDPAPWDALYERIARTRDLPLIA